MILLVGIALLILPLDAHFYNSPKIHFSDSLKVKCDALRFRSLYVEYGCFFAVMEKIEYIKAADQCLEILPGSKGATKVPLSIFDSMMIRKSDFHLGSDSSGSKYIMCIYDNDYKCGDGQSLVKGRCILRAAKKMNFADAENYCADQEMEIPAPSNSLDSLLVRDALIKDPVWVQKSNLRENGFKWRQAKDFTKWTTCDRPADKLYAGSHCVSCANDTASVVDNTGYWSNAGTENLMEVVCLKSGNNAFMKGETTCKSYHATDGSSASQSDSLQTPTALPGDTSQKTCYTSLRTTTRNVVIGRATVETQRGCEVLCSAKSQCAGFSFKAAGFSSSCVLLSAETTNEKCADPTTIFQKKKSGCVARTNITAEFGVDPCIDERVDSAIRGINTGPFCIQDRSKNYIIRAITADGRRITLFNDWTAKIRQSGDMWQYEYEYTHYYYRENIVAAVCATADAVKCPCKPFDKLPIAKHWEAIPEVMNPCNRSGAYLHYELTKVLPTHRWYLAPADTAVTSLNCRAGMWMMWRKSDNDFWGASAVSCDI